MNRFSLIAILLLIVGGAAAFVFFGPSARPTPASLRLQYEAGDLSGTLAEISGIPGSAENAELQMLVADCYRQLGQVDKLKAWVAAAEASGIAADQIQLAKDLTDIQMGAFEESPTRLERELERRGASVYDARGAIALGTIANGNFSDAQRLLDDWQREQPTATQPIYLQGVLARAQSQWDAAAAFFVQAIESNPQHELSYLALSEFYSQPPNIDLEKSRFVLQELARRTPANAEMRVRLARVHRELGDIQAARRVFADIPSPSPPEILEKAELALDSGEFEQSVQLLSEVNLSDAADFIAIIDAAFGMSLQGQGGPSEELTRRVSWAATALALSGKSQLAAAVFNVALDRVARTRRFSDLQVQLALAPTNQALVDELNAVVSPAFTPAYPTLDGQQVIPQPADLSEGLQLYAEHCSVCHGDDGDGFGPAARHLFPVPRNFRREPMRMVSAENRLATDDDVATAIRKGQAGASMPAFDKLTDAQVQMLVTVVRDSVGPYEPIADERIADEVDAWVKARLAAGPSLPLPQIASPEGTPQDDVPRVGGSELYVRAGCQQCHPLSGEQLPISQPGISSQPAALFDSLGRPVVARDLIHDPYRGGNSRIAIYRRIVLGIPGTPHPALSGFSDPEILQLVDFVRQLSASSEANTSAERRTNFQRRQHAAEL